MPPKEVWFELRNSKIVEKEHIKFPGMRFIAGAAVMQSVPSERAVLEMIHPDLFDGLKEINKLLLEAQGDDQGSIAKEEAEKDGFDRLTLSDEEVQKLHEQKRVKELKINDSVMQEIAIVGRSNVGKSTMLNTLTESPNTARVSSKPGLTRQLNFYRCGEKFVLVDMPGYGFAFAKEEDKERWKELVSLMESL